MDADAAPSLTDEQRSEFSRTGFLCIPNAVDAELIARCRELVWESIPESRDTDELRGADNRYDVWDRIATEEPFHRLNAVVRTYATSLVGRELSLQHPEYMQLSVRYPRDGSPTDKAAPQPDRLVGHVDGFGKNFLESGRRSTFPLGASMYLNRVQSRGGGFTVWPGSHVELARHLHSHGADSLGFGGNPPEYVGEPFEIAGGAGTLVLWHGLLRHSGGVNLGTNVRMAGITRFVGEGVPDPVTTPANLFDGWDVPNAEAE